VTTNRDLIDLAMRMVQKVAPNAGHVADGKPETSQQKPEVQPPRPVPTGAQNPGLPHNAPVKETKTADDLATMILNDLKANKQCPMAGMNVTVYGSSPWNSWLSFAAAAGPVRNKAELQEFCDIITERLKRLYDISP
jgi:hypothetical protein